MRDLKGYTKAEHNRHSNMKQNTTEAKKINMFKTIGLTRLFLRD